MEQMTLAQVASTPVSASASTTRDTLREITVDHLEALAIGAGILGTGGGGNPYLGKVACKRELTQLGRTVPIVPLHEVPDDAVVASVGGVGAPVVGVERLAEGTEFVRAIRALEHHTGKTVTHIIAAEIGGGNSIAPIRTAAQLEVPMIDADAMGRAFPELQMDTFFINGVIPTPMAIADIRGHTATFDNITDANVLERYVRVVTVQMGGGSAAAGPMMGGAEARRVSIPNTLTLAVRLGEAVLAARRTHADPSDAALAVTGGQKLFHGKIVDVERRLEGGFNRGHVTLEGTGPDSGRRLTVDIQNENLVARAEDGTVLCAVPDLICIVDAETAEPITTEVLRYGLRVTVLGIPAPAMIATPRALEIVGPAAFGYPDVAYVPLPGVYGQGIAS